MATGYKLWMICPSCKGTGLNGDEKSGNRQCSECSGIKYIVGGWCSEDTYTIPENLPSFPE